MKFSTILAFVSAASAHTLFTTLYVNGKNQGDGTCVRMPKNGATGTAPIYPVTGDAMACGMYPLRIFPASSHVYSHGSGYGGRDPVDYVCPAPSGAKLTFEWRLWPDASHPGSIDPGHKGPCAVYVKRVGDMFAEATAAGPGWFKIWEDGFDNRTREWCTDRLIRHEGLMSVDLPSGLAPGYYLVRPEILALHGAYRGDPQFYIGCAQVFVQGGPSTPAAEEVPGKYTVSIPGYVEDDTPGLTFDIYKEPMPEYPIPGPEVYVPTSPAPPSLKKVLDKGAVPSTCLLKNANWCARPVPRYSDQAGCWKGVKDCYDQSKACWASAPASGSENCYPWSAYCADMNDACERGEFDGPARFEGEEKFAVTPEVVPEPWHNDFAGTDVGQGGEQQAATTAAAAESVSATSSGAGPTATPSNDSSDIGDNEKSSELLNISTDGKCGSETGQTCSGSTFGECCSKSGECGRKARHCSCGCDEKYGTCWN